METRFVVILTVLFICVASYAQTQDMTLPKNANRELIENNLLDGLKKGNYGLQSSCALMLGKMKSERAVIPLMALFRKCDDLHLKTAIAWALCNIGDPRGTFVVKREAQFNDCCKTKLRCAWYYETMVKKGTFTFEETGGTLFAELRQNQ